MAHCLAGSLGLVPAAVTSRPCLHSRLPCRPAQLHRRASRADSGCQCKATESGEKTLTPAEKDDQERDTNWLPAIPPEELPKGTRKEVNIAGEAVLLFWYRNEIYAIESRSPAEGNYSEGFIQSKLTQDYGIECPTTSTVFSLKTGEILVWYPRNPVLRLITPKDTCRRLSVFPVRLTQDAIEVDISSQVSSGRSAKNLQQSQNNDVMVVETREYLGGSEGDEGTEVRDAASKAANIIASGVALTGAAGAGTLVAIYKQNTIGLYVFWAFYVVIVGALVINYFRGNKEWL